VSRDQHIEDLAKKITQIIIEETDSDDELVLLQDKVEMIKKRLDNLVPHIDEKFDLTCEARNDIHNYASASRNMIRKLQGHIPSLLIGVVLLLLSNIIMGILLCNLY